MARILFARAAALAIASSSASVGWGQTTSAPDITKTRPARLPEVVVTASRTDLLGSAITASQGAVTREAIELRPIYRVGQLYETVPGLVVTVHSGESKANQYLLRGFDLDHGTDFASFVDGMPVNRGTNAHGQGYADQNFLMPEVVAGLDYTKGPYYAQDGDFSAVGSAHVRLTDDLANKVSASVGTLGEQEAYVGATYHFDSKTRLWGALEIGHLDGPWDPPSNFQKVDAAFRFSAGDASSGYSLTGFFYQSGGKLATDQSVYAVEEGLIGRYGVLDPTDHGRSSRWSVSQDYHTGGEGWSFQSHLYDVHSTMSLNNNFTHYLLDPVNGDQEQQDETRDVVGGDVALTIRASVLSLPTETLVGLQERYDGLYVDRRHTLRGYTTLDYCEAPAVPGGIAALPPAPSDTPAGASSDGGAGQAYAAVGLACNADRVALNDLGGFVQTTIHITPWLRTELGFREEYFHAHDHSLTTDFTGSAAETLPQPKGSLIFGPWLQTELYLSGGRGFHSNDVRGVFGTVGLEGLAPTAGPTPLLAPAYGEEIGLRTTLISKLAVQLALFQEDFSSELAFDEDQGQDQPTAPSRRDGVEFSAQYRLFSWMEFNTDLAFVHARYRGSLEELANVYQLAGPYITGAPSFIGSAGVLVNDLGPWSGSVLWRSLGPYPVVDGSESPSDKGYSEVNLEVGYAMSSHLRVRASVYNLLNTHANASAFDYDSQLTPTAAPVTGLQIHPLEPLSARFELTYTF